MTLPVTLLTRLRLRWLEIHYARLWALLNALPADVRRAWLHRIKTEVDSQWELAR